MDAYTAIPTTSRPEGNPLPGGESTKDQGRSSNPEMPATTGLPVIRS